MRQLLAFSFIGMFTSLAGSAIAGPGFAYSWLESDQPFERCMAAAGEIMKERAYVEVRTTRFGVTGETDAETLYINCEDRRHISLVLMRTERPGYGEIDALVALLQQKLSGDPVQ